MKNLPRRKAKGNLKGSRGPSVRRRDGDPLGDLQSRIRALADAKTAVDRQSRKQDLTRFLGDLSEGTRKAILNAWHKLTLRDRKAVHQPLVDLGGSLGPGASLLQGMLELEESRLDAFPSPPNQRPAPLPEEFWRQFYRANGLSEEEATTEAAKIVAEDRRDEGDLMRDLYASHGMPPDAIESTLIEDRRNEKWTTVANATLSAELAVKQRKRREKLRPLVEQAARLSRELQTTAGELAWRLEHIAIDQIGIEPRDSSSQQAVAWAELQSTVSEGGTFADVLWAVSQMAEAVAAHVGSLNQVLSKPAGGQESQEARQAAKELKAQGLKYPQIADVLAKRGLVPDSYTPEHVRDLLRKQPAASEPDSPGKGPLPQT